MSRIIWFVVTCSGMTCTTHPAVADDPIRVRVPVQSSGEIDLADLVAQVAEKSNLAIDRPTGAARLPVDGLAGALTLTFLNETLGPDIRLSREANDLVLSFDLDRIDAGRLEARLRSLTDRARIAQNQRERYGMHARKSYRPNDPDRPTICLLHGINSSGLGSFTHLIPELERAGFGVVYYDFPYNRSLEETSARFVGDWETFRADRGEAEPWAVVCHSMGGLLARYYVEGDNYSGDVSDLILLGTPNRGSAIAKAQGLLQFIEGMRSINENRTGALALLSDGLAAAAEDMAPESAYMKRLNGRPRREGVRYHLLAGNAGFLNLDARRRIETQYQAVTKRAGVFGGLARLAVGDLPAQLDELTEGTGDGAVSVSSTRLEGAPEPVVIPVNHVELIRGPLLYPEPGPVACLPYILKWLVSNDKGEEAAP
ncbi:hypothetical protein BH23PLA1_BH23PLA1_10360 [soil metagenome]